MSSKQRVVVRYSEAFKLKVVEEIESGRFTTHQARKFYEIGGAETVNKWLIKYGRNELLSKVVRVEMKDEKDRIKKLKADKKALESALAQAQLKIISMESMIEIAKDSYGFDIKKKLDAKASGNS